MKVFNLYPKQTGSRPIHVTIPKRFTYFWEINNYLSSKFPDFTAIDSIDPKYSIYYLTKKILDEKVDVLVMLVRIENLNQSLKFASFIKSINKDLKICIYGDLVNFLSDFFKKYDFIDAIVTSGDWEISISSYIEYLEMKANEPSGIYLHETNKEYNSRVFSEDDYWSYPNIKEIPIDLYNSLNGKNELSLTVGRGCPFNCKFCFSTCTFGIKEKRKDYKEVVQFIKKNRNNFDSFKLFAPTLTLDSNWVKNFCRELINEKVDIKWCGSSRVSLLSDTELLDLMAESGCYKISVGIETINESSKHLKKVFSKDVIIDAAKKFKKRNMLLKGLVMLGVPYQTKQDIYDLFSLMKDNSIQIRPTSYSPMGDLKKIDVSQLNVSQIIRYDKFTYYDEGVNDLTKKQFYELLTNPNDFKNILRNGK